MIRPNGGKYWRFKYRLAGKEQEMALGVYPEVSLKQARQRHQAAREMLASGIDPNRDKRDRKLAALDAAGNTFGAIAVEFDEVKMTGLAPLLGRGEYLLLGLMPGVQRPVLKRVFPDRMRARKSLICGHLLLGNTPYFH